MALQSSLVHVLTGSPAESAASLAGALVVAGLAAVQLAAVAPRLSPRAATAASAGLGAALLAGSALLDALVGVWLPVWPAVLGLLFGHLGLRAGRATRRTVLPLTTATATPRPTSPAKAQAEAMAAGKPDGAPQPPPAGAPLPFERSSLGRYRIDRQLGRGAMGAVYLGLDPKIGRQVAIKTMALSQEFDGPDLVEARSRFFREAETAGRLQHRDIVTIFDAGEDQDLAFIAMEFLKGHDLQRHTQASQLLPPAQVLRIVARVAEALAYAHSQGVVHRDVKPANVMIDPADDSVKVTDFGIARITDSSRTRTGMVLGTPSFMSPEQMAGRRVDGRSDLYSLGVMLFQLLTGRLPHQADSMAKLMYLIANEPAPDVRRMRADLPEALANVVALALEKRPEVRYADGHQFAADLHTVESQLGPALAAPLPPAPPESDGFAATMKISRSDPRHNSTP